MDMAAKDSPEPTRISIKQHKEIVREETITFPLSLSLCAHFAPATLFVAEQHLAMKSVARSASS
jgi:hypothetical protein